MNKKLTIGVEVEGLERLQELTKELAEMDRETSVFKAELGQGISFEGTKSDFHTFIKGMTDMMQLGMGKRL